MLKQTTEINKTHATYTLYIKKGEGRSLLTHFSLEPVTLQTLGARGPHVVRSGKTVILFSPNNFEQLLVSWLVSGRGLVLC